MAENIDFQFSMKKNCSDAIQKFCKDVPHGHARVIRCLQENLDNAAMPQQCKTEVADYTAKTANDYRHAAPGTPCACCAAKLRGCRASVVKSQHTWRSPSCCSH